ncbi:DoxX family protein [Candidatus Parcubacteria bacterium]|nr:MAG: DoxX family protein [Candidatus Parcubacteria bacterium]
MLTKWRNADLGILLVRLALAVVFIAHGWDKFQNISAVVGFFGGLGFPAFLAYLVAAVELLGGLAMLLGVLVEWAGALIAIVMLVAIWSVKFKMGFLGGYELDFALLLAALSVFFSGAGRYTIRHFMGKSDSGMQM